MSCIHITACQLASSASALPAQNSQRIKVSTCSYTYLGTKSLNLSLSSTSASSRYQRAGAVCLFGGKGKSENGNKGSPWTALENAVSSFKKNNSIEDVLRQQIQKQEYYDDGGTGGKPPRGGDGGGGGFGEAEDEGFPGALDEFTQAMLATIGIIFLYIYIIGGEEVTVVIRDLLRFLFTRQKSNRLRRLIYQWNSFFERMREKEEFDDPYWLEREILITPTWFDSPAKYWYIIKALDSASDTDADDADADGGGGGGDVDADGGGGDGDDADDDGGGDE